MAKLIQPPAGLSDAEESEWWYANRHIVEQEIEEAFKEGRMRPFNPTPPSQRKESVLLQPEVAKKVRSIAEKRGVDMDSLVNEFVQNELKKSDAA